MTDKVKTIPCWMTSVTGPQASEYDQLSSPRSHPSLLSSRFKKNSPKRCVSMCAYDILSDTRCCFKVVSGKEREDERTRTGFVIGFDSPAFVSGILTFTGYPYFYQVISVRPTFPLAISCLWSPFISDRLRGSDYPKGRDADHGANPLRALSKSCRLDFSSWEGR